MQRALIAAVAAACGTSANAQIFTFESLSHGEIITNSVPSEGLMSLSVSATNPNRSHNTAAAFDTGFVGVTADPDLQGPPWGGGNLAADNTPLGVAVIIARDNTDADNDGILDDVNDEGNRPAGTLSFAFSQTVDRFGFDLVDIEGVVQELSSLEFRLNGATLATVQFSDFTDSNSMFYDATITFGNNSANRIQPITASQLGIADFDEVLVNVGGSSAYDNIVVPTPASAVLGLAGLAMLRRRR